MNANRREYFVGANLVFAQTRASGEHKVRPYKETASRLYKETTSRPYKKTVQY